MCLCMLPFFMQGSAYDGTHRCPDWGGEEKDDKTVEEEQHLMHCKATMNWSVASMLGTWLGVPGDYIMLTHPMSWYYHTRALRIWGAQCGSRTLPGTCKSTTQQGEAHVWRAEKV